MYLPDYNISGKFGTENLLHLWVVYVRIIGTIEVIMGSSVINRMQSVIKYKELTGSITLGTNGYYEIYKAPKETDPDHLVKPSGMNNFLYAILYQYDSINGEDKAFIVDGRGEWICGPKSASISRLVIRYFYTD